MKLLISNVLFVNVQTLLFFTILYALRSVCAISGVERSCTNTAPQKALQEDGTLKYFCQYVNGKNRIILLPGSEFNHKCSTCKCSNKGLECCQPKPPVAPPGCITIEMDCKYRQVIASDKRTPCDLLGKSNIDSKKTNNSLTNLLNSKDAFVFFSTNTQISNHQDQTMPQQTQKKDSENEPDSPFMQYLNFLMQDNSYPKSLPQSNPEGHRQGQTQGYHPTNSPGFQHGFNVNSKSGSGFGNNVKRLETNSVQIVAAQPDKIDMDFTTFVQSVLSLTGSGLTRGQQSSLQHGKSSAITTNKRASGTGFTDQHWKLLHNRTKSDRQTFKNGNTNLNIKPIRKNEILASRNKHLLLSKLKRMTSTSNPLKSSVNHVAIDRLFKKLRNRTHTHEDLKTFISDSPPASYISPGSFSKAVNIPSDSLVPTKTPSRIETITKAPTVGFDPPAIVKVTVTSDPLEHLVTNGNMQFSKTGQFDSPSYTPTSFKKENQKQKKIQRMEPISYDTGKTSRNHSRFGPSFSTNGQGHISRNGHNNAKVKPSIAASERSGNIESLSLHDSLSLLMTLAKLENNNENKQTIYTNKPTFGNENANMLGSEMYKKQLTIRNENFNMGGTTHQQNSSYKNYNMVSPNRNKSNQTPIMGKDLNWNSLANSLSSKSSENFQGIRDMGLLNNKRNNVGQLWQNSKSSLSETGTSADSSLSNIVDKMVRQNMMQYLWNEKQTSTPIPYVDQSGMQKGNNPAKTNTGDSFSHFVDRIRQQKMMQYLFNEKQTNFPPIFDANNQGGSNKQTIPNIPSNTQMDSSSTQQLLFRMLMNPEGLEGVQSEMSAMNMFNSNMFPASEGPQAMTGGLPMSMLLRMNSENPFVSPMQGGLHSLKLLAI